MNEPSCIMDLRDWQLVFEGCASEEDKRSAAGKRLALVQDMRARPTGWTRKERKQLYKEEGRLTAFLNGAVLRSRSQVHPTQAHISRDQYGRATA